MKELEKLRPLALLLLRAALGIIFIYHGYPKLFTHTRDAMQGFVHMGFPSYFVYLAGVIEFFGGFLLILGLFTRIAALLIFLEMCVALVKVHGLFANPMNVDVYQFPLMLAAGAFALATVGAGVVSLDHAVFPEGRKPSKRPKGKDRE